MVQVSLDSTVGNLTTPLRYSPTSSSSCFHQNLILNCKELKNQHQSQWFTTLLIVRNFSRNKKNKKKSVNILYMYMRASTHASTHAERERERDGERGRAQERMLKHMRTREDTRTQRGERRLIGRAADSGARGQGFETYLRRVVSLSKTLYFPKVLVIPRNRWFRPDTTEKCRLGR